MVDNTAVGTAFGLSALTGIIDDIWVNIRQIHDGKIGIALFGKAQGLARKPFQGSVFAHVHHCICLEDVFYPPIIGQVMMRR